MTDVSREPSNEERQLVLDSLERLAAFKAIEGKGLRRAVIAMVRALRPESEPERRSETGAEGQRPE